MRVLSVRACGARAPRRFSTLSPQKPLRELWDRPLGEGALGAAPAAAVATVRPGALRSFLESAHHWQMAKILGDPMSSTPPSAKHLFISCAVIEGIFLCVNIGTMSPFVFEKLMPYHLKYTGLIIGWWGGTYCGLNVARYGPQSQSSWFGARAAAGPIFVTLGVAALALADGVPGFPKMGPWPSYCLLMCSFAGMAAFDTALHARQMLPPWLLKWKLGVSGLIVASLLLGVLKGRYLEANARELIMAAGVDD